MSNNLDLTVNFAAVDRLTKPYRDVTKTSEKFSKGVVRSATELDKLNKAQRKIGAYKKLEQRLSQGANKADKYRGELRDLKQQIKATDTPTKALTNSYQRKQRQLNDLIGRNKKYTRDLGRTRIELRKAGVNTRKLGDEQGRLKRNIDGVSKSLERQIGKQQKIQRFKDRVKAGAVTAAGTGIAVGASARNFSNNENADADLITALLNSKGSLPAELAKIRAQAKALGNKLPGTTADFFNVARTLSEQGVQAKLIANGGLKASSEMAVVLRMVPEEAAKMTAKAREAFGLAANELELMADLTQRAKFAFGLTPDDLGEANKYAAPTLNALKLTGIDNARLILAIEGLAAQKGLEGSSFGTSLSRFLDGTVKFSDDITKGSRSKEFDLLNSKNLKFDFFNNKGKFKGLEHAVKLTESWKESLSDQEFANLVDKMFGDQGKRVAEILAGEGLAGFNKAQQMLQNQASIQQRIGVQMSTLGAAWEATTGTLANFSSTLFQPIAEPLKRILWTFNDVVGAADAWLSKGTDLGRYSASLLSFAAALKISSISTKAVLGTASLMAPKAVLAFTTKMKSLKIFAWLSRLKAGLIFVAQHISKVLLLLPLLLTPWGLIGVAVGGLAIIMIKHWSLIKSAVATGIATIKLKISDGIEYIINTKDRWIESGKEMVNGLITGISQAASKLKDRVKALASDSIKEFKSLLGINSPSKVFTKLGSHLSEGVAVGVQHKTPAAVKSVTDLSKRLPKKLPALALGAALASAPLAAATNQTASNNAATFAPHIEIHIHGNTNDSAQDIARAVRVELDKAMRSAQQKHNTRLYD